MKRLLLATVSAVAITTTAFAADMAARAPIYTKAPPPVLPAWAGFYIGLNAGYARLDVEHVQINAGGGCTGFISPGVRCDVDADGGMFGGQIGYNWQSGSWVYGLEADMDWTWLKRSVVFNPNIAQATVTAEVDALGSLRGRLGFLAASSTLFYATGGGAFGHLKSGWSYGINLPPGTCCSDQLSKWKAGWVIGGGVEHMLTPNWLVRGEVLYYNLGRTSTTSANGYTTEFKHEVIAGRLGISYKW